MTWTRPTKRWNCGTSAPATLPRVKIKASSLPAASASLRHGAWGVPRCCSWTPTNALATCCAASAAVQARRSRAGDDDGPDPPGSAAVDATKAAYNDLLAGRLSDDQLVQAMDLADGLPATLCLPTDAERSAFLDAA